MDGLGSLFLNNCGYLVTISKETGRVEGDVGFRIAYLAMNCKVRNAQWFPHEPSTAHFAFIGLFLRVDEHVSITVFPGCKSFLTDVAFVWFVPSVLPDVPPEVMRIHKGGIAHVAFIWTMTCVNTINVVLQQSLPHKGFLTQLAMVVLFMVMCCLYVCEQVAALPKSGATNLTLVWFFSSVREYVQF